MRALQVGAYESVCIMTAVAVMTHFEMRSLLVMVARKT